MEAADKDSKTIVHYRKQLGRTRQPIEWLSQRWIHAIVVEEKDINRRVANLEKHSAITAEKQGI